LCSTEWADSLEGKPASSFYSHKEGWRARVGKCGSRRFPPNRGGTVAEHCRKYTVGYGAWRGYCPGCRPWSCGNRAGVRAAPVGDVTVAVEGTVLQAWRGGVPRVLRVVVLSRSRHGPHSRVVPMPFEGLMEEKYKESTGSWQHSRVNSVEHVLHRALQVPTVSPQCRGWRSSD